MTNYLVPPDLIHLGSTASPPDPLYTDGIMPKKFWVSKGGTDGDANGRPDAPFLTWTFAMSKCVSGRGDLIYGGPGSYAEDLVVDKANVGLIGTGNRHTGITQIIGSGSAATNAATVYVGSGYASGFKIANMELDTNGVAQAALAIVSSDTGTLPAAASAHYRFLVENVAIRSNDPRCGILLVGATLGELRRLTINGPQVGIGFVGSANNNPSDLLFEDLVFYNGMSNTVRAGVATVQNAVASGMGSVGAGANTLSNVIFRRATFAYGTTGAGGATQHIALDSTVTCAEVGFYDCQFATAPTNGTNGIATLPSNVVVLGHGTSGLVSLKG